MNNLIPESEEEVKRRIEAGMDDVLAGRTVPHSVVKEWASRLEAAARALDRKPNS